MKQVCLRTAEGVRQSWRDGGPLNVPPCTGYVHRNPIDLHLVPPGVGPRYQDLGRCLPLQLVDESVNMLLDPTVQRRIGVSRDMGDLHSAFPQRQSRRTTNQLIGLMVPVAAAWCQKGLAH